MQYGHFDNGHREYVIEKVDLPTSWTNYLGVEDMAAVVNHTAGAMLFIKAPNITGSAVFAVTAFPWTALATIFISGIMRTGIIAASPGSRWQSLLRRRFIAAVTVCPIRFMSAVIEGWRQRRPCLFHGEKMCCCGMCGSKIRKTGRGTSACFLIWSFRFIPLTVRRDTGERAVIHMDISEFSRFLIGAVDVSALEFSRRAYGYSQEGLELLGQIFYKKPCFLTEYF